MSLWSLSRFPRQVLSDFLTHNTTSRPHATYRQSPGNAPPPQGPSAAPLNWVLAWWVGRGYMGSEGLPGDWWDDRCLWEASRVGRRWIRGSEIRMVIRGGRRLVIRGGRRLVIRGGSRVVSTGFIDDDWACGRVRFLRVKCELFFLLDTVLYDTHARYIVFILSYRN